MARTDRVSKDVLLLDFFGEDSRSLHQSLIQAGFSGTTLVMEDDGFLPEGVISVVRYFCGKSDTTGRPRYFNQIDVPDYWEISGTNTQGAVYDLYHERGRIHYADPNYKRLVASVEWLDERGMVRYQDHYDDHGALYARTVFTKDGLRFSKSYFDGKGREVLVENYMTGDLILNRKGKIYLFHGKVELTVHLLEELGLTDCRLMFNSLGAPFFVSERLPENGKKDILFWQENVRDDIPGNMQYILDGYSKRGGRIMVQKKPSYDKLLALGASAEQVKLLGFIYPYVKENGMEKEVLICTNSDRIWRLTELVEKLPDLHFHIAALTEMSAKLMDMDKYDNVSLYPAVRMERLDELFKKCDYYLDINYESEIVSAVKRAFLHNQMILGCKETLHNPAYMAKEQIYTDENAMAEELSKMVENPVYLTAQLELQRQAAQAESKARYCELLWAK